MYLQEVKTASNKMEAQYEKKYKNLKFKNLGCKVFI